MDLCDQVLVAGMKEWILLEDTRLYPRVGQNQFHQALKTELLLAKSEPISNSCGASVITYLGKGEKHCCIAVFTEKTVRRSTICAKDSLRKETVG